MSQKQFNFRSEPAAVTKEEKKPASASSSEKKPKNKQFKSVQGRSLSAEQEEKEKMKFHSESASRSALKKEEVKNPERTSRFLCVLDFEAVFADDCKTNRNYDMEIIEFPSVLLKFEKDELVVVDEIQNYVKTRRIPKINEICTQTTGITQQMVDSGVSFEEALNRHNNWLESHLGEPPSKENVLICTCGDWDIKTMIPHQVYFEKHTLKLIGTHYTQWCNVKDIFGKFYNMEKVNGMLTMLNRLKLPLIGKHHSGIDDCKNIARVVCELAKQGCLIDATCRLKVKHGENSRTRNADIEFTHFNPKVEI